MRALHSGRGRGLQRALWGLDTCAMAPQATLPSSLPSASSRTTSAPLRGSATCRLGDRGPATVLSGLGFLICTVAITNAAPTPQACVGLSA